MSNDLHEPAKERALRLGFLKLIPGCASFWTLAALRHLNIRFAESAIT